MAFDILMVTSEAWPLAKTGGLGDAVSGLAQALVADDAEVSLLMPAWRGSLDAVQNLRGIAELHGLPGGAAKLLRGDCKTIGVPVLLLQNDALYDRESLYVDADGNEYHDNAVRFAALSMAAARIARGIDGVPKPAIVHAHDWHAALTPLYIRQLGVADVKTMLTLHNVAFQGVYPLELAESLGIEPQYCTSEGVEFWGQMNFLKAGIHFADLVSTVSRNYAREILTSEFGCGLEGALAARGDALIAIPNGIDATVWDPSSDTYLTGNSFSVETLGNKTRCKRTLQRTYGLDTAPGSFLLAMCSRLTHQKMADVAAEALPIALERHRSLQVCILGKGEKPTERALSEVLGRYPGRCGIHIGYSEQRAHMLHAGADALLHGSRFEPFGLAPLYAMRYGTVPIASRVGGMVDTIVDPDFHPDHDFQKATGILFEGKQPADMVAAIERALMLRQYPVLWRTMQRNGMTARMGWERSARRYLKAYRSLRPGAGVPPRTPRRDELFSPAAATIAAHGASVA